MEKISVLDHGYIGLVESWGSDESIITAARMSTGKGFLGWEPGVCPTCSGSGFKNTPIGELYTEKCNDCNGTGKIPGDLGLLKRLWIKKHATPFEMAGAIFEVQAPIMVFREWHRHRTQSYNEMSARYTPLPDVNYVPTLERLFLNKGTKNNQAAAVKGSNELTEEAATQYLNDLNTMWSLQQKLYEGALKIGIPKEIARLHIGVGRYSRMRASANLRNWLGFLTLRMAEDAQLEIRLYANEVCSFLQGLFPRTIQLFLEGK